MILLKKVINDELKVLIIQKDQLDKSQSSLNCISDAIEQVEETRNHNKTEIDRLIEETELILSRNGLTIDSIDIESISDNDLDLVQLDSEELEMINDNLFKNGILDVIETNSEMTWQNYIKNVDKYVIDNNIDLNKDPFDILMSPEQKYLVNQRINQDYKIERAKCDKYDYYIAATCGVLGALVDIFFVGKPGESRLSKFTDDQADSLVEKFAKLNGWTHNRESDSTKSAMGYLEKKFLVNYDQRHGGDVEKAFKMSTKNHHLKSLSHSPSPVGLFFSILNQFTSTSSFISDGRYISVQTKDFELQGSNLVAKIYCGFINWIGHIFSDLAGSSGAAGRGSGVPIPFYELLQFANWGSFGEDRQSFATIAVKVFEEGYDLRHGATMAIPVLITELFVRIMWTVKQRFDSKKAWEESLPFGKNDELRRMLLVSHGCLCLIDATDAGIRSGGNIMDFLLRFNMIAWVRFASLGLKEVRSIYTKTYDTDLMEVDLNKGLEEIYRLTI